MCVCVCTFVFVCVYACVHTYVSTFCTICSLSPSIMLLLVVQQYDLERLKKDADAEKEREATLLEERWEQG